MKSIIIYGAGNYGKRLLDKIVAEGFGNRVKAFVDRNQDIADIGGIPVVAYDRFIHDRFCNNCSILIALADRYEAQKVAVELNKFCKCDIYLLDDSLVPSQLEIFNSDGEFGSYLQKFPDLKPTLPYMEFQVADQCNLNCRSCAHFSNLVESTGFPSPEEYDDDLRQLSLRFISISRIRLMGGEPLLNPELPNFCRITRQRFPYSEISIVTNGIMIPRISKADWAVYRETAVKFDVSQYPPLKKHFDIIVASLRQNEVRYDIGACVDKFFVNLSKGGKEDYAKAFNEFCLSKVCNFLRNGRLFACPRIPMAYDQREKLGFDFSYNEYEESSIDLYNERITGWDIIAKLNGPAPMCRICTKTKYVPWQQSESKNDGDYFA